MFRCPNCAERTISLWEKMKASGWSGQRCPTCRTLFAPSWFGVLFASTVGVLGMVLPLVVLSPFPMNRAWLVLGLGGILGFALAAVVYLFATPLVSVGSSQHRTDRIGYVILVAGLALIAIANEYLHR
jgi:hypothetical protein